MLVEFKVGNHKGMSAVSFRRKGKLYFSLTQIVRTISNKKNNKFPKRGNYKIN